MKNNHRPIGQQLRSGLEKCRTAVYGLWAALRLHARLTKRYYSPVEVAARPVPTKEDPTIAQKVERMRAWMKEHGIDDPPVQRRPPRAVGRGSQAPARPVSRTGNQQ